jgi:hypothetical protein
MLIDKYTQRQRERYCTNSMSIKIGEIRGFSFYLQLIFWYIKFYFAGYIAQYISLSPS